MTTANNNILLIMPYLEKGLGIRQLANHLSKNGFNTTVVFFKELQSLFENKEITEKELSLLKEIIEAKNYLFVGLSIHSSLVIYEIKELISFLKKNIKSPFVIGGVYASIEPKECAKHCDIVIKGEGEFALVEFANALKNGKETNNIPNLCYFNENKEYVENELRPFAKNLDNISSTSICKNVYFIENNEVSEGDPQLKTSFYEISASRGCPFNCSFCCSANMRRIYQDKGQYLRFRSVESIMNELNEAIRKNPKIEVIRFWDEVFSNDKKWVSEFVKRYRSEIGLPFHAWGHPSMVKDEIIKMLRFAGLQRIVVGFQSGSPNVRNNIFKRPETNEQIIQTSKILSKYKIPEIYYDLMICHPLETLEELKETFYLCLELEPPFIFEMHQLAYQPGAEIIKDIIDNNICSKEELKRIFQSPFKEQNKNFLEPIKKTYETQPEKEVWANLIYLTQFPDIRKTVIKLSKNPYENEEKIAFLKESKKIPDKNSFIRELDCKEKKLNHTKTIASIFSKIRK